MIVLDRATGDVDNLYFQLPENLQAHTPEEVRNVVWIRWGEKVVGKYDGFKGKAIRRVAEVNILETGKTVTLLLHKTYEGGDPPRKGNDVDGYGKRPYAEILEAIEGAEAR